MKPNKSRPRKPHPKESVQKALRDVLKIAKWLKDEAPTFMTARDPAGVACISLIDALGTSLKYWGDRAPEVVTSCNELHPYDCVERVERFVNWEGLNLPL